LNEAAVRNLAATTIQKRPELLKGIRAPIARIAQLCAVDRWRERGAALKPHQLRT
jgi:hypothetical protein